MKRRNFFKSTGIFALSAAGPSQIFAQNGFSYEDAVGFYPDYTDVSKTAENSKSLFATRRLIRGL